jgi:hypothetical protein
MEKADTKIISALCTYIEQVMLKTKIVQILFSQMHQNYAKYTFETFTVDGIIVAYDIR